MEYGCSVCEYISSSKEHVIRHINRKRSCGPGIKELIEIPTNILCQYCNNSFANLLSLGVHIKKNCKTAKTGSKLPVNNTNILLAREVNETIVPLPTFEQTLSNTIPEIFNIESVLDRKIKEIFTEEEEQIMFSVSFQGYLKFNPELDFIIDFDQIWQWVGYTKKENAKRALVKAECLEENKDYKIEKTATQIGGAVLLRSEENLNLGGRPNETVLLTINCFKKFCMMAGTKRANKIHDYYIKLERCLFETRIEENLNLQLRLKDTKNSVELALLKSFHLKHILYLIKISESEVKFGYTSHMQRRLVEHKRQLGDHISLEFCIETMYNIELESSLKLAMNSEINLMTLVSNKFESRIFCKIYDGKTKREFIRLDQDFTMSQLQDQIIQLKESINKDEIIRRQNEYVHILCM